ncbi:hypothetical protein RHGRI_022593 [Rhododendron griersonianum]|uniref:Uncharacterized protein n=1 Tax=Rhododendron griersonianum TaxID=479676 RepID=A0AAV6J1F7_9ERIC|nr:hypothetical protein RHGRI_022593 [Rhododendron griersonianum]
MYDDEVEQPEQKPEVTESICRCRSRGGYWPKLSATPERAAGRNKTKPRRKNKATTVHASHAVVLKPEETAYRMGEKEAKDTVTVMHCRFSFLFSIRVPPITRIYGERLQAGGVKMDRSILSRKNVQDSMIHSCEGVDDCVDLVQPFQELSPHNLHWNVAFNGVLFSYIDGVKVSITKADITRHSLVLTPLRVMIFLGMLCPLAPLFVRYAEGVLVPMGLALGELICPLIFEVSSSRRSTPTPEELRASGEAFGLGGHQIARRVWKDYYCQGKEILNLS